MTIQERLVDDVKTAMRRRNQSRLDTLRMVRAAIHDEEIARRTSLDEDSIIQVISRMARQHRESIEQFHAGNREDLVGKEEVRLAVLTEYLPEQISHDELVGLAQSVIDALGALGPTDRGKVMAKLMPLVRGKADGSRVNEVVVQLLGGDG